MGDFKVADVIKGHVDSTGVEIRTVYSKVGGTYAVYQTAERVMIQFADDDHLGGEQRLALSPLNPLRGEINGLIDGWRGSKKADQQSKARLFDRRTADALTVALQGDQAHALELLTVLKSDILEERTSVARTQYLLIACASAVLLIVILSLVTARSLSTAATELTVRSLLLAAGVGAVGALFSIALAIRNRSILTDLQSRDNAVDAALRIAIGAISAVVLFCLISGELVTFGIGGKTISFASMTTATSWAAAVVIAFAAGFSERLVGDILQQSVLTKVEAAAANPIAGGAAGRGTTGGQPASEANERNPLGRQPASSMSGASAASAGVDAVPDDDDLDCCVADVALGPHDLTDDIELPEASGGVEKPGP